MSTAVKASHPIGFTLLNNDEHPILDIVDDGEGRDLKLEITNSSGRDLKLADFATGATDASEDKHHFELRFRPGVLSDSPQITLAGGDGGWVMGRQGQPDGTVSLYLLSKNADTLKAGAGITLKLQHVSAQGGARGTRAELKYRNLQFVSTSPKPEALVPGHREQHLSVVNQRGKKDIPLHVGFVGSNKILNAGSTPNTLTLRITNLLKPKEGNITLNAASQFILSCDVSETETEEWALAKAGQVGHINVEAPGWKVIPNLVGESAVWTISPLAETLLEPTRFIELTWSEIITSHPSGQTNLYVHYENIPGYWDGDFVCVIEKAPVVYKDQNVGIGTTEPRQKLEVAGNIQLGVRSKLFYQGDPSTNHFGSLAFHTFDGGKSAIVIPCNAAGDYLPDSTVNLGGFGSFDSNKVSLAVSGNVGISNKLSVTGNADFSGNVGLGTGDPAEKLEVAGSVYISGANYLRFPHAYGDANDGKIGNSMFASGLDLVGINNDNTFRKIQLWGQITQNQNDGTNSWAGTNYFSGNVGIGTNGPQAKLHVAGNAQVDGDIKMSSDPGIGRTLSSGWRMHISGEESLYLLNKSGVIIGKEWGGNGNLWVQGDVGIGRFDPQAPLHVGVSRRVPHGIQDQYALIGYQWNSNRGNDFRAGLSDRGQPQSFDNTSICAEGRIVGLEFNAFSDSRIKENLSVSDLNDDLNLLKQFKVTDYQFKDFLTQGNRPSKGFIAEEVEQIFPQAVSHRSDFIPNIYAFAEETTLHDDVLTVSLTDAHNLAAGDVVRLITETEGVKEVSIKVVDEKTFAVDGWKGTAGRLFVHGKKVDDFRTLDYQQVFSLGISGIQQLAIQVDELKAENDALQKRLTLLESKFETAPSVVVAKNGSHGNGTH